MARILEIDPARRIARVQPGVVLDTLRAAAEKHHLTFAPDPATHDRCTLGGMIGNNSCGVHSVMAGKTETTSKNSRSSPTTAPTKSRPGSNRACGDSRPRLSAAGRIGPQRPSHSDLRRTQANAATYGDLVRQRFPTFRAASPANNLNYLLPENGFHVARALVGSEGTCVTVLEAACA